MAYVALHFRYCNALAVLHQGAWILVVLFSTNAPMSSAQEPGSQVAKMMLENDNILRTSKKAQIKISDVVENNLSSIDDKAINTALEAHGFELRPYKAPDGADIFSKYFRVSLLDPFRYEIRITKKGGRSSKV